MFGGIGGIIGAIVTGLILGLVGRLLAPGKQKIPFWLTILVGIVAAFVGTWLAGVFGVKDTPGIDWIRHAFQVAAAIIGVVLAAGIWSSVTGKKDKDAKDAKDAVEGERRPER